jgi:hypothetical protein
MGQGLFKKKVPVRKHSEGLVAPLKISADIYAFSFNAVELLTGGKRLLNLLSENLQNDVEQLDRSKVGIHFVGASTLLTLRRAVSGDVSSLATEWLGG